MDDSPAQFEAWDSSINEDGVEGTKTVEELGFKMMDFWLCVWAVKENWETSFFESFRFELGEASRFPPELAGLVIIDSATILIESTAPKVETPGLKLRMEAGEVVNDDGVSPENLT